MSSLTRRVSKKALAWLQVIFFIVLPIFGVIGVCIYLGTRYKQDSTRPYYIWLIADLALNIMCCLNYLAVVERIDQEQNEAKDTFDKVSVLESTEQEKKEHVHSRL